MDTRTFAWIDRLLRGGIWACVALLALLVLAGAARQVTGQPIPAPTVAALDGSAEAAFRALTPFPGDWEARGVTIVLRGRELDARRELVAGGGGAGGPAPAPVDGPQTPAQAQSAAGGSTDQAPPLLGESELNTALKLLAQVLGALGYTLPGFAGLVPLVVLLTRLTKWGYDSSLFHRVPSGWRWLWPYVIGGAVGTAAGLGDATPLWLDALGGVAALGGGAFLGHKTFQLSEALPNASVTRRGD